MQLIAIPVLVMPFGTLVYLVAVGIMYKPLGLLALAVSPSIVASVTFFVLLYCLSRRIPGLPVPLMVGRLLKHAAIGGAAVWVPGAVLAKLGVDPMVSAVVAFAVGLVLYVAALAALRDRTLIGLFAYVRRAGPRRAPAGGSLR